MSAEPVLTLEKASAIVAPIYEALNEPAKADVKSLVKQSTSLDFMSCATEGDCIGRESAITRFKVLGRIIPDLHWAIREIQVAGDEIIVRGEATGTPVLPFLGIQPTGKSFKIMSIDIHIVKDGKVARTYHVESWTVALRQLGGK